MARDIYRDQPPLLDWGRAAQQGLILNAQVQESRINQGNAIIDRQVSLAKLPTEMATQQQELISLQVANTKQVALLPGELEKARLEKEAIESGQYELDFKLQLEELRYAQQERIDTFRTNLEHRQHKTKSAGSRSKLNAAVTTGNSTDALAQLAGLESTFGGSTEETVVSSIASGHAFVNGLKNQALEFARNDREKANDSGVTAHADYNLEENAIKWLNDQLDPTAPNYAIAKQQLGALEHQIRNNAKNYDSGVAQNSIERIMKTTGQDYSQASTTYYTQQDLNMETNEIQFHMANMRKAEREIEADLANGPGEVNPTGETTKSEADDLSGSKPMRHRAAMTDTERKAMRQKFIDMGYSEEGVDAAMGVTAVSKGRKISADLDVELEAVQDAQREYRTQDTALEESGIAMYDDAMFDMLASDGSFSEGGMSLKPFAGGTAAGSTASGIAGANITTLGNAGWLAKGGVLGGGAASTLAVPVLGGAAVLGDWAGGMTVGFHRSHTKQWMKGRIKMQKHALGEFLRRNPELSLAQKRKIEDLARELNEYDDALDFAGTFGASDEVKAFRKKLGRVFKYRHGLGKSKSEARGELNELLETFDAQFSIPNIMSSYLIAEETRIKEEKKYIVEDINEISAQHKFNSSGQVVGESQVTPQQY